MTGTDRGVNLHAMPGIRVCAINGPAGRAVYLELEDGADETTADRSTCFPPNDQYTVTRIEQGTGGGEGEHVPAPKPRPPAAECAMVLFSWLYLPSFFSGFSLS